MFLQLVFISLQVAQEGFHFGLKYFLSQTTVCFLHKMSNHSHILSFIYIESYIPKHLTAWHSHRTKIRRGASYTGWETGSDLSLDINKAYRVEPYFLWIQGNLLLVRKYVAVSVHCLTLESVFEL